MFAYSICYNLITYNIHRHKVSAWAWVPPCPALVVPSCPRPRLFPPYQDIKTVKSNYKHMSVFHGCMSRPRTKLRSKLKSDFRVWPCHAMICNAYHLECSVCTSKGLLHYRRHSCASLPEALPAVHLEHKRINPSNLGRQAMSSFHRHSTTSLWNVLKWAL